MLIVCFSIFFRTSTLDYVSNFSKDQSSWTCQVLFKSRCDNKLSEITERAAGDKREVCLPFEPSVHVVDHTHLQLV